MVGDLVNDGAPHLLADGVRVLASSGFDGPLEEGDGIGRNEIITLGALGEGDAVVEAKERKATRDTGSLRQIGAGGPGRTSTSTFSMRSWKKGGSSSSASAISCSKAAAGSILPPSSALHSRAETGNQDNDEKRGDA
jgi:hypothetical protein